jgi:excisionase family DNA binding protein
MQGNAQIRDGLKNKAYVSQRAAVCLRTVDYWIERNLIPFVKIGSAVRFLPADVDAFITAHRVTARRDRTKAAHKSKQIHRGDPMT